jgi:hypothetical protein
MYGIQICTVDWSFTWLSIPRSSVNRYQTRKMKKIGADQSKKKHLPEIKTDLIKAR